MYIKKTMFLRRNHPVFAYIMVVRPEPLPKVGDFGQLDPTKLPSEAAFCRTYQLPCRCTKRENILGVDPCGQIKDWWFRSAGSPTLYLYVFIL